MLGGLQEVAALDWTGDVKILFHICDAPAHGRGFNGGVDDSYKEENYPEPRSRPEELLRSLAERKVRGCTSFGLSLLGGLWCRKESRHVLPYR